MEGFIAKRITLSGEALEMLKSFRKAGSFRSLSQTVEELTRRIYYIKQSGTVMAANIQLKRLGISELDSFQLDEKR